MFKDFCTNGQITPRRKRDIYTHNTYCPIWTPFSSTIYANFYTYIMPIYWRCRQKRLLTTAF